MARTHARLWVQILALVWPVYLAAQTVPASRNTDQFRIGVEVNTVTVPVTVRGPRGSFLTGLPQTAFRILEDGREQEIVAFAREGVPLRIAFLLDTSSSVALIEKGMNLQTSDVLKMHYDVHSPQAERFMRILKPLLPDTEQGKILKEWDSGYGSHSKGALLFERFYRALYREVFGKNGLGLDVADFLGKETGIFIDFYLNFDEVLLSEKSSWFNGEDRDTIFRRVAKESLKVGPKTWGQVQQVTLTHILFGGKLPRLLGFDRGPITIIGGRATVHQGQIYRSAGRLTTFAPSFRTVTDFAEEESRTNIAGGPSDRRFSKWYCSDLQNWVHGRYKVLSPNPTGDKLPM